MDRKLRPRILDYLALHAMFLFYAGLLALTKVTSGFPPLSTQFIALFAMIIALLAVYAFFWQKILKRFPLSVAYSSRGIIIAWTLAISVLFFHEAVRLNHIAGVALIAAGICLVTRDG